MTSGTVTGEDSAMDAARSARAGRIRSPRAPRLPLRTRLAADIVELRTAARFTRSGLIATITAAVIIQGATLLVAVPAIRWLFQLALDSAGIRNVTDRNVGALLVDPLADLLLIAIAAIALVAVALQLAAVFAVADRQHAGRALTLRGIATDAAATVARLLRRPSPLLLVYLFIVAPLGGLGLFSVVTQGIAIPPFVTREYLKTPAGTLLYSAVIGLVLYINSRLVFTVPALITGRLSPLAAMVTSIRITRRRFLHFAFLLGVPALAASLLSTGVVEVLLGVASRTGAPGSEVSSIAAAAAIGAGQVFGCVAAGAAAVLIFNVLVHEIRVQLGHAPVAASPRRPRRVVRAVALRLVAASVVVALAITAAPAVSTQVSAAAGSLVFAHRGFSAGGVENTIAALDASVDAGADYVEADFQQTADGGWVALHDTNLLMISGLNRNVFDMTTAEATSTTVREGGFEGTIPTMADYVSHARAIGMPLLIEVKVHGHEHGDFVQDFLAQLDALGVTDQNIYHSLDPDVVSRLKTLRPALTVGLTIAVSAGGVPDSPCDFFTLEQASFTPEFLAEAHAEGKPVYVWTVDGDDRIRDFLRAGADGIVTDQPDDAVRFRDLLSRTPDPADVAADELSEFSLLR
ncbi:glycerophosphodiester phosphodiesterase [Leifsonia sp. Leaf264]|uniref:glycerophosphodiester phosphodiesterase n=1 Tax=Leifsonia sp. Leaf264 TaxID=1736314 RepID=UPI000A7992E8|nr:glycerophosphodiester phosphodiesterase [Leifsonia sp. Leaf264]